MPLVIGQPGQLHVGDVGVRLRCQVRAASETPYDLSEAVGLAIRFQRPDGTLFERTAEIDDEDDGVLRYVTADGDVDQEGYWHLQAVLTFEDAQLRSNRVRIRVLASLPAPD